MASNATEFAAGTAQNTEGGSQAAAKYPPGTVAPAEGPIKEKVVVGDPKYAELKKQLKPNMTNLEDIFPEAVRAMRELMMSYRIEGIVSRRWEAMRMRLGHLYWMGLQNGYYDPADWQIHFPFGTNVGMGLGVDDDAEDYDSPEFDYVTNYYQAYGLDFMALISARIPTPKFYPQSAQNERDITTAKAADDVRKLNEKNNPGKDIAQEWAFQAWCDGKIGGYVRWVRDGHQFGWENVSDLQMQDQKMGEDVYSCPQCGAETPASQQQPTFGMAQVACQQCGAPLTDEDLKPAENVQVPVATNDRRVPKGAVVMDLIPGLQFHTPPWANKRKEFPYLQWNVEIHKAKLKATFPSAASKITAGAGPGADDQLMRVWRLSLQQGFPIQMPGDVLANLSTFSRSWIEPWAFWDVEDADTRALLLDLFPDGCYNAFAGEAFCEARNENMDECWVISHAMKGDGQNRPSVGDSSIDVNRRINDLDNIEQETACYGIPTTFADSEVVNMDALQKTPARPGDIRPAKGRPGTALRDSFATTELAEVSPQQVARRQELAGPVLQRLTGIQPALYGGELPGSDTLGEYAMAREQGMQRLGLFYRQFKLFYGRMHLLGVKCFRDNAADDAELPTAREGGAFEAKYIRLAELQGNIEVYEEEDEAYPALPSEVRSIAMRLLQDEFIGPILAKEPGNIAQIKDMNGLQDFTVPGEDQRIRVLRAIRLLLQGTPIEPDQDFDDGPVCMTEIRRWAQSDEGQQAEIENPNFQLVRQYYYACRTLAQQQQQQTQQTKPPSESMNFKDLPPEGQAQMANQAGIQLDVNALRAEDQQEKIQKAAATAAKVTPIRQAQPAAQQ